MSQPEIDTPPAAPRQGRWANRLTIAAVLLLVLVPLGLSLLPGEIARWYAAAAQEDDWSGRYEAALARLDKAIVWDPQNPQWWLRRATLHADNDHREAAEQDLQKANELADDNWQLLPERTHLAARLGKFDEAADAWQRRVEAFERFGVGERPVIYNGAAYFLALANRDLEDALNYANLALAASPRNPSLLDTRGFVFYRLGRYEEARVDLDQALSLMDEAMPTLEKQTRATAADPRQLERELQSLQEALAVMYYHRSLVLDKLGQDAEAALDRQKVRELGFTPGEHLF